MRIAVLVLGLALGGCDGDGEGLTIYPRDAPCADADCPYPAGAEFRLEVLYQWSDTAWSVAPTTIVPATPGVVEVLGVVVEADGTPLVRVRAAAEGATELIVTYQPRADVWLEVRWPVAVDGREVPP